MRHCNRRWWEDLLTAVIKYFIFVGRLLTELIISAKSRQDRGRENDQSRQK